MVAVTQQPVGITRVDNSTYNSKPAINAEIKAQIILAIAKDNEPVLEYAETICHPTEDARIQLIAHSYPVSDDIIPVFSITRKTLSDIKRITGCSFALQALNLLKDGSAVTHVFFEDPDVSLDTFKPWERKLLEKDPNLSFE
jgi:hypothetical protein